MRNNNSLTSFIAQINPKVGAIQENLQKIANLITNQQATHDLIIFPELALTGYPPEDWLLRLSFLKETEAALAQLTALTKDCHVIVGHPTLVEDKLYNSVSILYQGQRIALYHKCALPNYGVFDEARYFTKGSNPPCHFTVNDHRLALIICEDLWYPETIQPLLEANVEALICINASPFELSKYADRLELIQSYQKAIVYVNLVGAQDEILFDGSSMVMNKEGKICAQLPVFTETGATITLTQGEFSGLICPQPEAIALLYQALVFGLKEYVYKNGFKEVLLGLSGGIDSALTLAIAVDAFGSKAVHPVLLPSRFTADISNDYAKEQADLLKVEAAEISIEPLFAECLSSLEPQFTGYSKDLTEENIQARLRGLLLMALSNKKGYLLLSTSNKSETAVGYATLYGDMAGGFAVLKDVLKTEVYALAHYRNRLSYVIPEGVIKRAPSAELRLNQTDQDNLPDYDTLDAIIRLYMEQNASLNDIVKQGFDEAIVKQVINLIHKNEYKRKQAAPGTKVSSRAFGKDWRYPNVYKSLL